MSLLFLLVVLILLTVLWWFSRGLPAPWPLVVTIVCVVIVLFLLLSMITPIGDITIPRR